jgi:hypothetical protein
MAYREAFSITSATAKNLLLLVTDAAWTRKSSPLFTTSDEQLWWWGLKRKRAKAWVPPIDGAGEGDSAAGVDGIEDGQDD